MLFSIRFRLLGAIRKLVVSCSRQLASAHGFQPNYTLVQMGLSLLGAAVGIAALGYLSLGSNYPLIAAPFGASSVLLFGVPTSPLAQPRNVVLGNTLGGLVSVMCVHAWGGAPWVMGVAVGLTIVLMQLLRCVHPPAGAVALLGVLASAKPAFVVTPVFLGSLLLAGITILFSRMAPDRAYPKHWF